MTAEYAAYLRNIASLETQAQTRYDSMDEEFTAYEQQQKAAFEAWVESIKNILDGNAAGNLLLLINEKMQKATVGGSRRRRISGDRRRLELSTCRVHCMRHDIQYRRNNHTDRQDRECKDHDFVSKQKINEEYVLASGDRYTKTTTFGSNGITERIVKNE